MRSLYLFRRDLRLEDNTGLLAALAESDEVVVLFITTPEQVGKNEYKSEKALSFMIDSLEELEEALKTRGGKLHYAHGEPARIVETLIKEKGIEAIHCNHDYTPYAVARDERIRDICKKHEVPFKAHHDYLLNEPRKTVKDDGNPYTVFTPYYRKAMRYEVAKPRKNEHTNYATIRHETLKSTHRLKVKERSWRGGRKAGLQALKEAEGKKGYEHQRDYPAIEGTTRLSPHHKFGTLSIRESYWALRKSHGATSDLIRQLYWRDFFTQVAYHHPHVFGGNFNRKYDKVEWDKDEEKFKKWCSGTTGFPIVDAGMRELASTGWMHNRVRMITASFLTKHLHLDWRLGEKWFAQKLVDYDPCVNNGSWQWAASTGCDAQPWFRVFNPWRQQERFDPEAEYIKRWVPELKELTAKDIHSLAEKPTKGYPEPMVEHKAERAEALRRFQSAKRT
ncbi:MAG: cryptochrome/photolyase family protein [Candidatus Woesearchaeota archaeon]